jgi:hypothetical protein
VGLPVTIGTMSAIPPAVRYRVLDAMGRIAAREEVARAFAELIAVGTPWLGADPSLVEVGLWMTDGPRDVAIRQLGCAWLALFPTERSIERLAALSTEPPVRDAAIRALTDRQLRDKHPSTRWSAVAIQLADDALFRIADAATTAGRASPLLAHALRHVHSEGIAAVFARAPSLWGAALECSATAPLARVLAVSIDDIQPVHRIRVLRLIAATLGDDALPLMTARAGAHSATLDERVESLLLAIAFGGEAQLPRFEDALRDLVPAQAELLRKRARWHLANRGVVPTVRGLKIARTTAILDDRTSKCGIAADDLGALVHAARHPEPETYELWAWMVRNASDPVRARALVAAHPASLPIVRELVISDLARRGKVSEAIRVAQHAPDLGALALAIWGRPFAALELAAIAPVHTPELACARVLACHRAGRPDLAVRLLAEDPPPREIADDETSDFPGSDERWLAEHAPHHRPAITALVGGRDAILALAHAAEPEAEVDRASLSPLIALEHRLDRSLRGKLVCIAGELKERAALAELLQRAGAQVVVGPVPALDFYIAGEHAAQLIAQLERMGARRLDPTELA